MIATSSKWCGTPASEQRALYVEEIITLARLSRSDEFAVCDLAQAVLDLVEQLRDVSLRADLAEATLEVELKRTGDLRHKIAGFRGTDPGSFTALLHELAEVVQR